MQLFRFVCSPLPILSLLLRVLSPPLSTCFFFSLHIFLFGFVYLSFTSSQCYSFVCSLSSIIFHSSFHLRPLLFSSFSLSSFITTMLLHSGLDTLNQSPSRRSLLSCVRIYLDNSLLAGCSEIKYSWHLFLKLALVIFHSQSHLDDFNFSLTLSLVASHSFRAILVPGSQPTCHCHPQLCLTVSFNFRLCLRFSSCIKARNTSHSVEFFLTAKRQIQDNNTVKMSTARCFCVTSSAQRIGQGELQRRLDEENTSFLNKSLETLTVIITSPQVRPNMHNPFPQDSPYSQLQRLHLSTVHYQNA